jgi:hypothetical protein
MMKISEIDQSFDYKSQVLHSISQRLKRNFPNDTKTVSKITGLRRDQFWTDVLEPRIARRDYPTPLSLDYWKMIDELIDLAQKSSLSVER